MTDQHAATAEAEAPHATSWATLKRDGMFEEQHGPYGLEQLQGAVGGYVEAFDLAHGVTMWCNEEAKVDSTLLGGTKTRTELENWKATFLMERPTGPGMFAGDYIGGDVAFTGQADDEGDTLPLPAEGLAMIRHVVEDVHRLNLAEGRIDR